MKKIRIVFVVLITVLFFGACDDQFLHDEYKGDDWFYLENDGAIMPAWVRGNKSSNVFVIFVHGGPGGTSMDAAIMPTFKQLHNEYAFVYYDQRGAGAAQGNAKLESLTIEQFVEDLQKLVILIRYKYNNPVIFLMGHSWGGGLGTAYLLDSKNQQHIAGWIEINGAHNLKDGTNWSIQWTIKKANERINAGNNVSYWQKEINWYNNFTQPVTYDNFFERHLDNVWDLDGYFYDSSNMMDIPLWTSPHPLLSHFILWVTKNINVWELDLTPEMHKIKVPSLILWGKHDGSLPVELAENAYNNLGTVDNDKHIHIFEYSGHCPFMEEADIFVDRVKMFIEKYKIRM